MAARSAHVVPAGTQWQVKSDGRVLDTSSTQRLAIVYARTWLAHSGGGELVIHGEDGAIRQKDTIYPGNDPRNTRG